jgi:hypothetical protein
MTSTPCVCLRFEKGDVGGRAHSVEIEGQTIELGASLIWDGNAYVKELAGAVGLDLIPPGVRADGLFAVYDGRELVFAESRWWILNFIQMVWRYGLRWGRMGEAGGATHEPSSWGTMWVALCSCARTHAHTCRPVLPPQHMQLHTKPCRVYPPPPPTPFCHALPVQLLCIPAEASSHV